MSKNTVHAIIATCVGYTTHKQGTVVAMYNVAT